MQDLRQPVADLLTQFGEQHVVAFFLVLADAWHRDLETRVIAN